MHIYCSDAEREKLLEIMMYDVPCKHCLAGEYLCKNNGGRCKQALERYFNFDTKVASSSISVEKDFRRIIATYTWVRKQCELNGSRQLLKFLRDTIGERLDNLSCGVSSKYIDKCADIFESKALGYSQLLNVCIKEIGGMNNE